jgi:hypothetical protein
LLSSMAIVSLDSFIVLLSTNVCYPVNYVI